MNKRDIENAEYGVDSRYESTKERNNDGASLMEARLQRIKNLSKDQIIHAKLLQLKFKMEEYIKEPVYDNQNHFSKFLSNYIDIIYDKRSLFAKDIDITPVSLSQVINKHREPKKEFILRLMIHSEKAYLNVCEFHKKTWYQVYFHEKICDTMSSQDKWRPKIEKHVKLSKLIK
jgi:hypothetical protein